MHVEAGRIGRAGVGELLVSAPELNIAFIVAIEDPRIFPSTPGKSPCLGLEKLRVKMSRVWAV